MRLDFLSVLLSINLCMAKSKKQNEQTPVVEAAPAPTTPAVDTATTMETTAQKIERMRRELAELEKAQELERREKLTALPVQLGFGSGVSGMVALVQALIPYTKGRLVAAESKEVGNAVNPGSLALAPAKPAGTRAKVTPEMKQKALDLLKDTGMTAAQVSKEVGVSTATIAIWKREAGLTKPRK